MTARTFVCFWPPESRDRGGVKQRGGDCWPGSGAAVFAGVTRMTSFLAIMAMTKWIAWLPSKSNKEKKYQIPLKLIHGDQKMALKSNQQIFGIS